jgi:membrane-bound ClpP family serine protease
VQMTSRKLLVGAIAVVGIILIVLGAIGLRELLVVGKVPPERLGRQVAYATISLAIGFWCIVWCLVAGMAWARRVQTGITTGETRSLGRS